MAEDKEAWASAEAANTWIPAKRARINPFILDTLCVLTSPHALITSRAPEDIFCGAKRCPYYTIVSSNRAIPPRPGVWRG